MSLIPLRKSLPEVDLQKYTFLFYGERKIGKTAVASQFQNPLFAMMEPGGKALSIYQSRIKDWKSFIKLTDEIEKDEKFKTIVIDTGGRAYSYCYDYVLEEKGVSDPSEEGWGGCWSDIAKEFETQNDKIFETGKGVLITAHSEIITLQKKGGIKETKIRVDLGKQARRYYVGVVNTVLYFHYDVNGDRIMTIRGSEDIEAGTQIKKRFLYPDGEYIKDIPMGKDEEEAYNNLVLAYNNKLPRPKKPERKFFTK